MPREVSPISKWAFLNMQHTLFVPKSHNVTIMFQMVSLRDESQTPATRPAREPASRVTHVTGSSLTLGSISSPSLASYLRPLPPSTCHQPPLRPSLQVSLPEPHPPTSLFSAAASEWLPLFLLISCLRLRPWASGHLSGLVRGDLRSRTNRWLSINHQLSETKHSQVPSLNTVQSKDGAATDSNSPGCTCSQIS